MNPIGFIRGIFTENTPESSKRVFGAIGFICAIVFIAIWDHDLIIELLYVSASLIGLSTIVSPFLKSKTDASDKKFQSESRKEKV